MGLLPRLVEEAALLTQSEGGIHWVASVEPADLITPGQPQRLAEARTAGGREIGELAALLGISYEAYDDLERFDEEIVDALSFDQLLQLGAALPLDLRSFFAAEGVGQVTFAELAVRLERLLEAERMPLAAFEDRVGWELRGQLDKPKTFAELPAIALADIAAPLGLDWRNFLPPS
jgi:transcriptional regulator with XRE-family HTH domain